LITQDGFILTDEEGYDLVQESFSLDTQDPISDNTDIQTESDSILDFTERDPFSEGEY
jgi:hypothetical protein